ncbi:MAG TPA: hypothetical protein VF472_20900 [Burkholderiaceae bacterium]
MPSNPASAQGVVGLQVGPLFCFEIEGAVAPADGEIVSAGEVRQPGVPAARIAFDRQDQTGVHGIGMDVDIDALRALPEVAVDGYDAEHERRQCIEQQRAEHDHGGADQGFFMQVR